MREGNRRMLMLKETGTMKKIKINERKKKERKRKKELNNK
jgi:hypothetical protein